jgi:peptidyl-prolyl cis-trans isomerase A (cyclophilin A)
MIFRVIKLALSLLIIVSWVGCSQASFKSKLLKEQAPASFKARFETTKGDFEILAQREWSPFAVDRLYQLITLEYFAETPQYRVVEDFVAQFGNLDSLSNAKWQQVKIPDEVVVVSNERATISFARGGKETRGTQLFINLKDNNPRLDTLNYNDVIGFPVIAKVTKGMEVVDSFAAYGNEPMSTLDSVANVVDHFKMNYPEMDYIIKAYIIE